jgi:hypothetical protein
MTGQPPDPRGEIWDPFGTLRDALRIGGGQWAGKSTVARILARRYGLGAYHYDYHDARGHDDRRIARRVRLGEPAHGPDPDGTWVNTTPEQVAAATLAGFPVRFEWALSARWVAGGLPVIVDRWPHWGVAADPLSPAAVPGRPARRPANLGHTRPRRTWRVRTTGD